MNKSVYYKSVEFKMQIQPELHTNPSIYCRSFPAISRPTIVGYIGLENLKYAKRVQNEKVQYDLNRHICRVIRKPDDLDVKLTELLKFLLEHEIRLNYTLETNLENAKFFCYRGLMTCLACTPYENREAWKIVVILHKGSIFLCARDTDEKKHSKQSMTEKDKMFTSWGYKFEQYMLSGELFSTSVENMTYL